MEQANQLLDRYKYPLILSFVGVVLIIGGLASSGLLNKAPSKAADFPKESIVKTTSENLSEIIKIDIAGAIKNPGVYELNIEDRVEDAVKKAGGFAENVSQKYVSQNINLSQKISDGQKLYIPFDGENTGGLQGGVMGATSTNISINNASQVELESLPGVGAVTATKIISNRPYASLEDLIVKKALTRTTFNKIKDQIGL